jgi:aminopeptidase N
VAKVVRTEENWLSESFADYASAVCLERTLGDRGTARFVWDRQVREWKSRSDDIGDGASLFLWAYLAGGDDDARATRDLLYAKGPLVLHALRRELARQAGSEKEGDRLFFTWIRSYVRNFTFKPGETRHLVAILDQMTGRDWQPWFERYVYGTETPELR